MNGIKVRLKVKTVKPKFLKSVKKSHMLKVIASIFVKTPQNQNSTSSCKKSRAESRVAFC